MLLETINVHLEITTSLRNKAKAQVQKKKTRAQQPPLSPAHPPRGETTDPRGDACQTPGPCHLDRLELAVGAATAPSPDFQITNSIPTEIDADVNGTKPPESPGEYQRPLIPPPTTNIRGKGIIGMQPGLDLQRVSTGTAENSSEFSPNHHNKSPHSQPEHILGRQKPTTNTKGENGTAPEAYADDKRSVSFRVPGNRRRTTI
ncbi:Uncharacterized protein Rs2_11136 [Raphanus sativus]|nr:Uncharacterized protein Rs2_11136 [Raphanus sativus]